MVTRARLGVTRAVDAERERKRAVTGGEQYRARARRERAQYSAFSLEVVRVFVFFAIDLG